MTAECDRAIDMQGICAALREVSASASVLTDDTVDAPARMPGEGVRPGSLEASVGFPMPTAPSVWRA